MYDFNLDTISNHESHYHMEKDMRKLCLILLFLILAVIMASCRTTKMQTVQRNPHQDGRVSVTESSSFPRQYWGYIDKTGKLVIPMKYLEAGSFKEGLATARTEEGDKHLSGYINRSGNYVIKPKYLSTGTFNEGLAVVSSGIHPSNAKFGDFGWRSGYINQKGEMVIAQKFTLAYGFSEGLAGVVTSRNSKNETTSGYIDRRGKVLIKIKGTRSMPFQGGLALTDAGFINRSGRLVLPCKRSINASKSIQIFENPIPSPEFADNLDRQLVSDGLIPIIDLQTQKCGYMNTNGQVTIRPIYQLSWPFSEGLGRVQTDGGQGFLDRSGKMVISPQFRTVYKFCEGLAGAMLLPKRGRLLKFGFIDKSGKWVINPKYDSVYNFHEGMAAVCISGKWGFIDRTGNMIVQPEYDVAVSFSEGRAAVAINFDCDPLSLLFSYQ